MGLRDDVSSHQQVEQIGDSAPADRKRVQAHLKERRERKGRSDEKSEKTKGGRDRGRAAVN